MRYADDLMIGVRGHWLDTKMAICLRILGVVEILWMKIGLTDKHDWSYSLRTAATCCAASPWNRLLSWCGLQNITDSGSMRLEMTLKYWKRRKIIKNVDMARGCRQPRRFSAKNNPTGGPHISSVTAKFCWTRGNES